MSIQAFAYQADLPDIEHFKERNFLNAFLNSPDFHIDSLKEICRSFDSAYSFYKPKTSLISLIVDKVRPEENRRHLLRDEVIEKLVTRNKEWMAFRRGKITRLPKCHDPHELLFFPGKNEWYGPIQVPNDESAQWYIRPEFFPHWIIPQSHDKPQEYTIRWLVFARITSNIVSLHWRGFTHSEDEDEVGVNSRLAYWHYIPKYFDELQALLGIILEDVNLHRLVLHHLWDKYRYLKDQFIWSDLRIRAEGGGVALSARAGSIQGMDVNGIKNLAQGLRNSVALELKENHRFSLPVPEQFDEVILRTLIQEFGALSYEFSLETPGGETIFRSHIYFGAKSKLASRDSFPHLRVYISWKSDLEQLSFLLSHLDASDEKNKPKQSRLF
jgi:hypothetical protein